jgi:hypothetical protein
MEALNKYDNLICPDAKKRFLGAFIEAGSGMGKDSLKFAFEFKGELTHQDETVIATTTNMLTPGEILALNGQSFQQFETLQEALDDAKYLVAKNMAQYGWTEEEHPPEIDAVMPKYSKYNYIKGGGKVESWKQLQSKSLSGDTTLKDVKQLQDSMGFMEGLGYETGSSLQVENAKASPLLKDVECLRTTYLCHATT